MDPYGGKRVMWGPQHNESHHYVPIYPSTPGYVSAYEGAYAQAYNAPLDQYPMDSQAYDTHEIDTNMPVLTRNRDIPSSPSPSGNRFEAYGGLDSFRTLINGNTGARPKTPKENVPSTSGNMPTITCS